MFQPWTLATPQPSRRPRISRRWLTCAEPLCSPSPSPHRRVSLQGTPTLLPAVPHRSRAGERVLPGPRGRPGLRSAHGGEPRGWPAPAAAPLRTAPHSRPAALPAGRCPPSPALRGTAGPRCPVGQESAPAGQCRLPYLLRREPAGWEEEGRRGGGAKGAPSQEPQDAPGCRPRPAGRQQPQGTGPRVSFWVWGVASAGSGSRGPAPGRHSPETVRAAHGGGRRFRGAGRAQSAPPVPARPPPQEPALPGLRAHRPRSAARPTVLGETGPGADRVGRRRARLPTRPRPLSPRRSPRWRTAPRPPPLLGPA